MSANDNSLDDEILASVGNPERVARLVLRTTERERWIKWHAVLLIQQAIEYESLDQALERGRKFAAEVRRLIAEQQG